MMDDSLRLIGQIAAYQNIEFPSVLAFQAIGIMPSLFAPVSCLEARRGRHV